MSRYESSNDPWAPGAPECPHCHDRYLHTEHELEDRCCDDCSTLCEGCEGTREDCPTCDGTGRLDPEGVPIRIPFHWFNREVYRA